MPRFNVLRAFVLWIALSTIPLSADVPQLISFQGRLTDQVTGVPVDNGSYDLTFTIYDAGSGALWIETQNDIPVLEGLYHVLLGSVNSFGMLRFDQQLFLGIRVDSDPEMSTRYQLASSASALAVPDTIDQITLSQIMLIPQTTPPSATSGAVFYDSNINTLKYFNGVEWTPLGNPGPRGDTGLPGTPGGSQGDTGPIGATGIPGTPGGAQGFTGATGSPGLIGMTGPRGYQGTYGPRGATGIGFGIDMPDGYGSGNYIIKDSLRSSPFSIPNGYNFWYQGLASSYWNSHVRIFQDGKCVRLALNNFRDASSSYETAYCLPLVAGPGQVISSWSDAVSIQGYLAPATVRAITWEFPHDGVFIVPPESILVILNMNINIPSPVSSVNILLDNKIGYIYAVAGADSSHWGELSWYQIHLHSALFAATKVTVSDPTAALCINGYLISRSQMK